MAKEKKNYITQQIQFYGEGWINIIKPDDIQRSMKRIVKEMVLGNFNYEKVGNYFMDMKFIDNLLIALENELEINTLLYNALRFYAQYNPDIPNISIHINHLECILYIYNTIKSRFEFVKGSGNIGYLADVSSVLYQYRNHL